MKKVPEKTKIALRNNSFMIHNGKNIDSYEDVSEYIKYNLLGICGCCSPEIALNAVLKVLRYISTTEDMHGFEKRQRQTKVYFGHYDITDDPYLLYVFYILDDRELIEHGTSICYPWLTELGEGVLEFLEEELKDDDTTEEPEFIYAVTDHTGTKIEEMWSLKLSDSKND